jgi:hypothetical protein
MFCINPLNTKLNPIYHLLTLLGVRHILHISRIRVKTLIFPEHRKTSLFQLFVYWRYNPLWVLAFSVILFHSALSSHCFLYRLTPIICKSSSVPAIHLFCGLPLVLVPIDFHCNILLGVLLSSIRIT